MDCERKSTGVEMRFLLRVAGLILCDGVRRLRRLTVQESLEVCVVDVVESF